MYIQCEIKPGPLSYVREIIVWCDADECYRRFLVGDDVEIDGGSVQIHESGRYNGLVRVFLDSVLRPLDGGPGYFWRKEEKEGYEQ